MSQKLLMLLVGGLMAGMPLLGDAQAQMRPGDQSSPTSQREKEMRDKGCWVEIYDDNEYDVDDPHMVVIGPLESATLKNLNGRDWNNDIESLIMGPKANMRGYADKDFQGTEIVFAPNQRVPDLAKLKMGNQIESLRITCTP